MFEAGTGWERAASQEGNPHTYARTPPTHKPAASPGSRPPAPYPGLRCSRLRSATLYPTPTLSNSTSSPTDPRHGRRGSRRWPLPGWGLGPGGRGGQTPRPPGGGCLFTSPRRVRSLGRGLGRGGSELEPCLSRRCRVEQMVGEGRGYVAGGGGVRGPTDEEPRISTPESPRRRPPPHSSHKEGWGEAVPAFFPGSPGLWPATDPTAPPPAPGRAPHSVAPPPPEGDQPAGSRPQGAAGVAWVNGAALRGARGRWEAGS